MKITITILRKQKGKGILPDKEMVETELLIKMYEKTLIKEIPFNRFYFKSVKDKHQLSLLIFRYAMENILKWTPEEIRDNLDDNIINDLRLDSLYRFMEFPDELSKEKDYFYIAHLLYPSIIRYDKELYVYNHTMKLLEENKIKELDNFMIHNDGYFEAFTKKMLQMKRPYMDSLDLYECFYNREFRFLYGTKLLFKYIDLLYDNPVQIIDNVLNINYFSNYYNFRRLYDKGEQTNYEAEQV